MLSPGSSLTTVDGGITMAANMAMTATGDFLGIEATAAQIRTTGNGTISLNGVGGRFSNPNLGFRGLYGVGLRDGTSVSSTNTGTAAGKITISGTGGAGANQAFGVRIQSSSTITSVNGDIAIMGHGGITTQADHGVMLSDIGTVSSTGVGPSAAKITINGTAGGVDAATSSESYGVILAGVTTDLTSVDGDISIIGIGGIGRNRGGGNVNVYLSNIETVSSLGSARITIDGNTPSVGPGFGVLMDGATTDVTSINGDIVITGTGYAGGIQMSGIAGISKDHDQRDRYPEHCNNWRSD